MTAQDNDRSIHGVAKTVAEVLAQKKYSIDYYQREYRWEAKQVAELVADLTNRFLELHRPEHSRSDVASYPGYYLGSIIVSQKGSQPFIVDGQQRLTTLTLFLTYLRRLQRARPENERVDVDQLIFSEKFGQKSFNLDVADRNACMQGLFDDGHFEPGPADSSSVRTLVDRYSELDELMPNEVRESSLPYFVDWLKDRVQLVQITAYADDDAYSIFETMNDRGLKLTPADMLKGYLLANMKEGPQRNQANDLWRENMRALEDRAADAGADFLKTWLRSQYSTKIRQRSQGAKPEDWDRIGTEFHRWLRGAHEHVGLKSPEDFYRFVSRDLDFYSRQYQRLLAAASGPTDHSEPLRFIRYNADLGFTLQYQLLLAPLRVEDDARTVDRKLEIVGRYVDIMLAWRIWNFRSTAYSTMQYTMFNVMRDIRGLPPADLARALRSNLLQETVNFDARDDLFVHQQNRRPLHRFLARLTDHISVASGQASNYVELTNGGTVRYEVEHVWADHPERHSTEFAHESEFHEYRNKIGDLLLLPKPFNASYNDEPYEAKRPRYFSQNLLAASLDPQTYDKNPGFLAYVRQSGLPFQPYETFTKADLAARGHLYRDIARTIWNPDDLLLVADAN